MERHLASSFSNSNSTPFCGSEGFSPWVNGRFGTCFSDLIIGSIPHLVILIGGSFRLFFIWSLRKDLRKLFKSGEKPQSIKLTTGKVFFFWIKFIMCILIFLLGQIQLVYSLLIQQDPPTPSKVTADVLSAFFWGKCTVIILLEYQYHMAHGVAIRWFWIIEFICSLLKEYTIIVRSMEGTLNLSDFSFISFQFLLCLEFALAILGGIGFIRKNRKNLEPQLHPSILKRRRRGFSQRELWNIIRYNKWMWLVAAFFSVVKGVLIITFMVSVSDILNLADGCDSFLSDKEDELWQSLYKFAGLAAAAAVCTTLSYSLFGIAGMTTIKNVRTKLMSSLMMQDISFITNRSPGALISHLSTDTDKIGKIRDIFPNIVGSLAQIVTGAIFLFRINLLLTLVILSLFFIEFVEATIRYRKVTQSYAEKYSVANKSASDRGTEILSSYLTVRLFVQEKKEARNYAKKVNEAISIGQKKEWLESIFEGAETLINAFIIGVGVMYSYVLTSTGQLQNKDTIFILIGVTMLVSFSTILKAVADLAEASSPAAVLNSIMKRKPALPYDSGYDVSELNGVIQFQGVYFKYPIGSDHLLIDDDEEEFSDSSFNFKDFTLKIKANSTCAFVSPEPDFKTALFDILLRFYNINKGSIVIDKEYDLRDINVQSWLRCVGFISQEPILFNTTIKENILYGIEEQELLKIRPQILEERLLEVAKKSNLEKLINEKGWNWKVGERGSGLTLSEKQRVSIARVFMKEPQILLIDEITCSLNPEADVEVITAMEQLMVGRTTIIAAHRLHALINIENIYVLKEGTIIDKGRHSELISRDGIYKMMWETQQGELLQIKEASGGSFYNSQPHLSSDMDALLDLLHSQSESLKENYPDIHALLRQIRPQKRTAPLRYVPSAVRRKVAVAYESAASKELLSFARDGDNQRLLEYDSQEENSSSSSSFF